MDTFVGEVTEQIGLCPRRSGRGRHVHGAALFYVCGQQKGPADRRLALQRSGGSADPIRL